MKYERELIDLDFRSMYKTLSLLIFMFNRQDLADDETNLVTAGDQQY